MVFIFPFVLWLTAAAHVYARLHRTPLHRHLHKLPRQPAAELTDHKVPIRRHLGLHENGVPQFSNSTDPEDDPVVYNVHLPLTVSVETKVVETGTVYILPTLPQITPQRGIFHRKLNLFGRPTQTPLLPVPIASPITQPLLPLQPHPTPPTPPKPPNPVNMPSSDIFAEPIDTKGPPPSIPSRPDHPVPRTGLTSNSPLQTNKFYSNFFLGDRQGTTYTFPYSVAFNSGRAPSHSWGIACNHVNARQRVFGPNKYNNSASYYLNPVGIQSLIISAKELGNTTTLTMDSITAFSARVNLARDATSPPAISFPLVQGMPYITAQFNGAIPMLETGVFFKNMTRITRQPKENVAKYVFVLEDNSTWRLYAWRTRGDDLDLKINNNGRAEAQGPFYGILQICKDPVTDGSEKLLDDGAGVYPETVQVTGTASGSVGTYTFHFQRAGHPEGNLYMYALPHHVSSFSSETAQRVQKMQLDTTTKGCATFVKGNEWTMEERNMPVEMGFNPWHPERGSVGSLSDHAKQTIRAAAQRELQQNMIQHSNLDSMYFSGKVCHDHRYSSL